MDEIFKGFRNKTPQNLHKQFMAKTFDNRPEDAPQRDANMQPKKRLSHKSSTRTPGRGSHKYKSVKVNLGNLSKKSKTPARMSQKVKSQFQRTPQRTPQRSSRQS